MSQSKRTKPNILVTGTPGTGKTTACGMIAEATGLRHLNVGDLVKAEELHSGWDDEFECLIIDEDKVGEGRVGGAVERRAWGARPGGGDACLVFGAALAGAWPAQAIKLKRK